MKKTELKNCPQWLLDANTTDEDVDFDKYGVLIWRGGEFRGGEFLGGYFLGGEFLGGEFRGGEFRGGEFRGGEFLGGEFRGGEFLGEKISKAPLFIFNIGKWSALITQTKMSIGCKNYLHEEWAHFDDQEISDMDSAALEFWKKNKLILLELCKFNQGA